MGLLDKILRRKTVTLQRNPYDITEEELNQLSYVSEFDLSRPGQLDKVLEVKDAEERGLKFVIRKPMGHRFNPAGIILPTFPSREELWEMVKDTWGGGTYVVHIGHGTGAAVIRYTYDAPATFYQEGDGRSKNGGGKGLSIRQTVTNQIADGAVDLLNENPELKTQLMEQYLREAFKLKGVKEESWEEKVIREKAESDPEFMDMVIQRAMKRQGYKLNEEEDPIELQIKRLEQFKRLAEIAAPAGTSNSAMAELIKGFFSPSGSEMLKGVLGGVVPGVATPAITPQPEPKALPAAATEQPNGNLIGLPQEEQSLPAPVEISTPLVQEISDPGTPAPPGQGLTTSKIDWGPILMGADWREIAAWVQSDAGEFMQFAYTKVMEEEDDVYAALIKLFRDNSIPDIYGALSDAKTYTERNDIRDMIIGMKGKDAYDTVNGVLNYLLTVPGQQWVEHAHGAALHLQHRITAEFPTGQQEVERAVNIGADQAFSGEEEDERLI